VGSIFHLAGDQYPHLPIDIGGGGKKSGGKIEKSGEKFGFFRES
jgi:hypothetical protein